MQVLIVDDEQYITEYLKHLVDWQRFGFQTVHVAHSGEEALAKLAKHSVALVITDIRMPETTGLMLSRQIMEQYPQTKVMLLSGYSDFGYAQEAIHYGVSDYLLKPLTEERLAKALTDFITKYPELVLNTTDPEQAQKALVHLINAVAGLIQPPLNDDTQRVLRFFRGPNEATLQLPESSCVWRGVREAFGYAPQSWSAAGLAYSAPFSFANEQTLREAFYQFFGGVPYAGNASATTTVSGELASDPAAMLTLIADLPTNLKPVWLVTLMAHIAGASGKLDAAWLLELKRADMTLAHALITQLQNRTTVNNAKVTSKDVIAKVNEYVDAHLNQNLTLETLAAKVYLHPAYLSKLYKQVTGENFSTYLATRRIEKAAKLLLESTLMVSDIGKMVGYHTSQYFIRIFKEQYGMTPQQYRRANL
ncbi:response regulator transcription factor [Lacticaseibacillus jixiensis]|uniref:response regulator transcription factor n=1 Tax=Lacticaseibacillus jixiensis TaxID=3231926 RepID=UPI0036F42E69